MLTCEFCDADKSSSRRAPYGNLGVHVAQVSGQQRLSDSTDGPSAVKGLPGCRILTAIAVRHLVVVAWAKMTRIVGFANHSTAVIHKLVVLWGVPRTPRRRAHCRPDPRFCWMKFCRCARVTGGRAGESMSDFAGQQDTSFKEDGASRQVRVHPPMLVRRR